MTALSVTHQVAKKPRSIQAIIFRWSLSEMCQRPIFDLCHSSRHTTLFAVELICPSLLVRLRSLKRRLRLSRHNISREWRASITNHLCAPSSPPEVNCFCSCSAPLFGSACVSVPIALVSSWTVRVCESQRPTAKVHELSRPLFHVMSL
jgi:hypothetical protein